jgi:hypothetical protein
LAISRVHEVVESGGRAPVAVHLPVSYGLSIEAMFLMVWPTVAVTETGIEIVDHRFVPLHAVSILLVHRTVRVVQEWVQFQLPLFHADVPTKFTHVGRISWRVVVPELVPEPVFLTTILYVSEAPAVVVIADSASSVQIYFLTERLKVFGGITGV